MTPTEKRIEMVKRLVELRRNDEIGGQLEKPGDTILRGLRALALEAEAAKKKGRGK